MKINKKATAGYYTATINGVLMKHPVNVSRIIGLPYDTIRMQVKRSKSHTKEYIVDKNVIIMKYNPYIKDNNITV